MDLRTKEWRQQQQQQQWQQQQGHSNLFSALKSDGNSSDNNSDNNNDKSKDDNTNHNNDNKINEIRTYLASILCCRWSRCWRNRVTGRFPSRWQPKTYEAKPSVQDWEQWSQLRQLPRNCFLTHWNLSFLKHFFK